VPGGRAPVAVPASRPRLAGAITVGIAIAATVGFGLWLRPKPERREARLNVLLITVDTLRADALGSYGYAAAETPWMDRLAAEGVRFENVHAQNVVTLPSHANILTGRYPLDHGVRDNSGFRLPPGVETLATLLKKQGYHTGAFVSAFPLDSRFGLDRGFDVYDDRLGDPETRTAFVMQERPGARTVEAALRWLGQQGSAPTFTWVHIYEPHFPYTPPEPFASRFAASPYHGEVAYSDAVLRPLLEPLLRDGANGRTIVALTGDHGEGLGEHGEKTHGIFAYETTLRVPLLLYSPRLFTPATIRDRVRHIDLLPTLLDALALKPPEGLPGRSLLSLAQGRGPAPAAPSYFEALSASLNRGWAPLAGIVRDHYKLIELPEPELYDLDADPRELTNLAAREPLILDEVRSVLKRQRASDRGPTPGEESAETRERLRSLGYASASAPKKSRSTIDDDPKRLIALNGEIEDVVTLYESGDLQGALSLVRRVVSERPGMSLALQHLAFLEREAGDLAGAVATLKKALTENPGDVDIATLLGAYLNEIGRSKEAASLLQVFADRPDPDIEVLLALGAALAQAGRAGPAIAAFERALAIDPTNAAAKANLGTAYLVERDYPKAEAALREALSLDPDVSRAHNALGVIAVETDRPDEAIEHWKRAVELNPREWDTVFNLAKLLRRRGRMAEAEPYVQRFVHGAPSSQYAEDIRRLQESSGR